MRPQQRNTAAHKRPQAPASSHEERPQPPTSAHQERPQVPASNYEGSACNSAAHPPPPPHTPQAPNETRPHAPTSAPSRERGQAPICAAHPKAPKKSAHMRLEAPAKRNAHRGNSAAHKRPQALMMHACKTSVLVAHMRSQAPRRTSASTHEHRPQDFRPQASTKTAHQERHKGSRQRLQASLK